MLTIYRTTGENSITELMYGYDDITLFTGNSFIDSAAREEANESGNFMVVEESPDPYDPLVTRHNAKVCTEDGIVVAVYYGVWK